MGDIEVGLDFKKEDSSDAKLLRSKINYAQVNFIEEDNTTNPLHQSQSVSANVSDAFSSTSNSNTSTYDSVSHFIVPLPQKGFMISWLADSYEIVSSFKGFVNRQVHLIQQRDGYAEYVTVIRFSSFHHFKAWFTSKERSNFFDQLNRVGITFTVLNAYGGQVEGDNIEESQQNRIALQNSALKIPTARPPPKWKLTLVVVCTVYVVVAAFVYSGQGDVMLTAGLPRGLIALVFVIQVVTLNVYALAPCVMEIPLVDRWLKAKRPPADSMHPIQAVLDQGLKMFALKIQPPPPAEILSRLDKIEAKLEKLRDFNFSLKEHVRPLTETRDDSSLSIIDHIDLTLSQLEGQRTRLRKMSIGNSFDDQYVSHVSLPGSSPPVADHKRITMAVRHYVKWECIPDFEVFSSEIEKEMKRWPGFLGMVKIQPKVMYF
jgi:antibiotic biosynthesis monooxygenase (ABM) superfamily enzyme